MLEFLGFDWLFTVFICGHSIFKCAAAPIPESPAPTINTSKCAISIEFSVFILEKGKQIKGKMCAEMLSFHEMMKA